MRSRMRFIGGLGLVVLTMQALAAGSPAMEVPSETWAPTGNMAQARSGASAALLQDGSVLIVGGVNGDVSLASAELFKDGSFSAAGSMLLARSNAAAVALKDGRVLIAGGSDGSPELASAELGPRGGAAFIATANMASPRRSHSAFLLSDKNSVLIVGGSADTAELYRPWSGAFVATGAPAEWRGGAAGSPLLAEGLLLMAGGSSPSAELYGFPTVKTDKADYAPGSVATIIGSGWQPGEWVTLTLVEEPLIDAHPILYARADAFGQITNSQFVPDEHDAHIQFYLTAVGSVSQAQNTFTDDIQSIVVSFPANGGAY